MRLTGNNIAYENLQKVNQQFEIDFKEKFHILLKKGWYVLGDEVADFEKSFSQFCGSKYCIGVANGLDALVLGVTALELPVRSQILVPSNTYIATILAIINAGHIPVLVEPDAATCNIDPAKIEEKINARTKAILAVHLYGQPAQMDAICSIATRYNLEVIEDCAQAHGATFNGKMVGTFGNIGAYSFYPTKNLGALGDAGAIITSNERLYKKLKALRNYGSEKKYFNEYIGFNSRLDELQAVFLNVKLPFLNKINGHKRELADLYNASLTEKIIKPKQISGVHHVYHIYNIRTRYRDQLKDHLLQQGIYTEIHYPVPAHKQAGYCNYFENMDFPVSEEIHSTTLSLPISFSTTKEEVKIVIEAVNRFFDKY